MTSAGRYHTDIMLFFEIIIRIEVKNKISSNAKARLHFVQQLQKTIR
jgi:hypothetical protein